MMPFQEDFEVCELATHLGLEMSRYEAIEITDQAAITSAGLTCTKPDYSRIRKALREGAVVEGARLKGVEYILRRNDQ